MKIKNKTKNYLKVHIINLPHNKQLQIMYNRLINDKIIQCS